MTIEIQKHNLMAFLTQGILLLFILTFALSQTPSTKCPLLCSTNCTAGTTCATCYSGFASGSATTTSCSCPQSMYLDSSTLFCKLCPIYCQSCMNYTVCTSCVTGFILKNNYSCILNTTNLNGWVSKNVTYQLTGPDYTGVSDLVILTNGSALNLTNNPQSIGTLLSSCSKLSPYTWLGGYQSFGFNTKIIKTIFNLPPHQWVNVMFQAVLIDTWYNNTLLLQVNTQQDYNSNTLQNPSVIWSSTFDSRIRTYDFCGNSATADNLAVANTWIAHNASSIKLQIRLHQSESTTDPNNNLNSLYFGVRQLYIRVGTCGRYCQFCSSPSNCTKCSPPYVEVNGSCVCDINLGSGFPTLTGCSPICTDGQYYNATAQDCLSCKDQYDNCQTCNMTQCLTCNPGYLYYSDTLGNVQCLRFCPENFTRWRRYPQYSTQTVNNTLQSITLYRDQCVPCPSNCKTCNPNNICLFCVPGYLYHKGQCVSSCPGGYFSVDSTCMICPTNCTSCSISGCTTCVDGFVLQDNRCYRSCYNSTTLLIQGSDTCNITCSSPCLTCYGPAGTQCLSCNTGTFLAFGSCLSSCPAAYYANGDICNSCPSYCGSCLNASICLTCYPGFYLWETKCIRNCPPATYPYVYDSSSSTSVNTNACLPCAEGCRRCSDANTCIVCAHDYKFFNFSCVQDQPDYFQQWQSGYRICSPNCLKCNHRMCTRCANNTFLNQGLCIEKCPPQKYPRSLRKYDDGKPYYQNICVWKDPLCSVYNSTLMDGSCSLCSYTFPAAVIVQGWKNQPNFICSLTCPEFYTKTESLSCTPCPDKCIRCQPNMTCLQCMDGYSINTPNLLNSANFMNQTCKLNVCPQFYFSDSLQCQSCPQNCRICLLDNSCFICDTNYVLDPVSYLCINSNCSQISQFYNGASCQACVSPCRSCFGSSTFCTSCLSPASSIKTYLYEGTCITSCPTGYFAHKYSSTCRLCNPLCASCSNFDNCITCKPNFFILSFYSPKNPLCVAECPIGFWTNTTICQRCSPDCKTCYGPSEHQCLSCYPNFYLDDYKCVYSCSPMKYKDNQGHCDWCHPSCQQCTGPSKFDCINCHQGQYYYDKRCFNQTCPGATYLSIPNQRICEPCQYGCQYCSSSQFCYFCTPGFKFYQGWCYSQCPGNLVSTDSRYYMQLLGSVCKSCIYAYSSRCLRCNVRSCKRCAQGYYLYRSSNIYNTQSGSLVIQQCFSTCPTGTYPRKDGGRQCINCQTACQSCVSYSNCTTCVSGYNLVNGYCTQNCPAYTYQTSSGYCKSCPDQCISCTSSVNCTACKANYYFSVSSTYRTMSCVSSCPITYYADQSGWCLRCPSTCVTCDNATSCTSCLTGYTLTNGVCANSSSNTCTTNCMSCSGGICRACSGSTFLYTDPMTGQVQCISSCPTGWFTFAGKCQICNQTCSSCSNTQNNCTSCVTGLYLYQQRCIPVCPSGFFPQNTNEICKPCPLGCINCNNGNCTLCASGFFLYQGICNNTCPPNTFASLLTQNCFNCTQNCLACQDIENCTVCAAGYSLFNSSCITKCPSTTYVQVTPNGQVCMTCVSPCFTCSGPNTCQSCIATYILNGSTCQQSCGAGFYARSYRVDYDAEVTDQDFSTFLQCLPCNIECLTCRDYSSRCITCAVGFVLANGRCLRTCPDGTYNSSSVCMPCSSYCVTCNSINVCAVCVQGTVLYNGLCLSNCPQGNYMVLNTTAAVSYYYCAGCSSKCQSCNGSTEYNCLSCNVGFFLSNGMCLQACPQGTYPSNLTRTCSPCPVTCTNCTSFSNCGGCITSYTLSNTNQCNPPDWIVCNVANCVSCSASNSSQCQQCITNYYLLSDGICSLTCPNSTYAQTGQCINCPTTCTSCTPTQCTACQTNYYLYNGICSSTCPVSTLPNENTCIPDPCLYYNNSYPYSCLACTTPYLLAVTNMQTGYQSCVSSCSAGTVQSGSQCISCPLNCLNCQTPSSCLTCNNSTYLFNDQCLYSCPVGTYSTNSICQKCNISFCIQCNGPNTCTQCSSQTNTFLFNGQCYLTCPTGTYSDFNTGLCTNCSTTCSQCTSLTSCTSCSANYYFYQGACLNNCPLGTYNLATSGICNKCSIGCNNCTSETNCSFCQSGFVLYFNQGQGSCVTVCPTGYFAGLVTSTTFTNSNQYQCVACISPCSTCTSSTTCVTCISGYFFFRGACLNVCPSGYYASSSVTSSGSSQSTCLVCDSTCLTCQTTSTYCTTCPSGFTLDSQGNCNSNCSSPSTYYVATTRQCLNCSASCYSCQGPLSTDCLSCRPPLSLYSGSCMTVCPFGYYSTSTYVCKQCTFPCASCSGSSTNCTSCVSPYLLQTSNGANICTLNCLPSFYPNATVQMCYNCHTTCMTCSGPAANQCTSCSSNSLLLQGSCITSCPSGTVLIQQSTQSVCQACSVGCANCSVSSASSLSTTCTKCLPNFYLYKDSCFTTCPSGTYASPTSYTCTNCNLTGCQTCIFNESMTVQCTICQAGYYSLGDTGTCTTSCPSGYTLINSQCVVTPVCQYYTYNGTCIMNCPPSTYAVTSPSKTCVSCSSNCLSCQSSSSCWQCSNTTFLYFNSSTSTSTCINFCPSGLYADSNTRKCSSCGNNCQTCYLSSNQVRCTSCQSGYFLLGTQCIQSCPVGYYSTTSNVCQLCSPVCYSCSVLASNCTVCKNINYTAPSCASSTCTSGQYLTASGSCSNCNSACATCYGANSYECITCSSTTYNLNGQCLTSCPQGYIPDNNRNCVACSSNCATCTSSACTQCISGYYLVVSTGQCVSSCNSLNTNTQTYYVNGSSCNACTLSNCLVCSLSGSSLQCRTCQSNAYSFNNTCVNSCPTGTFPATNPNTCNNCSNNCTTCTSATSCTTCSTGFALVNGMCTSTCSAGSYLSTVSSVTSCNACSAQCLSCTSASACTSCAQPYALVSGQCSGCLAGYYLSSLTNTCLICSSSCATCSVQPSNCTACASGHSLMSSNTCVSSCPVGYYSSNSVCTSCSTANCAVCPSNACSSCQSGFVQVIVSGVITCTSSCPSANFLNSATNTCISCSSNCLTCTSATSCSQCSGTYLLYLGYCVSSCPSGFAANSGTCTACPVNCKLCSSITTCTTCVSSVYIIVNGVCTMNSTVTCSSGYYINSLGNCSQCYPTCQTCNGGSVSNCLTCFDGSTLNNGVCQQNCASGSFFNSNTSSCQSCSSIYTNCASCTYSGCTSCSGNYSLVNGNCTLTCPSGTYLSNQQCYSCSSYCSACTSSTNCTQCINTTFFLYNSSCYSSCPVTTYTNAGTCSPCFQTCLTCTNSSSSSCLSCITPYNYYQNTCIVTCPNGTYASNYTCQVCSSNCLLCSSSGCSKCSSSFYLINGTCRSNCPNEYYVDTSSSSCISCVSPCTQCTSRTACTACISSYTLTGTTCVGQCPIGQYFNSSLSGCTNCSMTNCAYCTSTSCSACQSTYYSYYSNGVIAACISTCNNIQGTFNDNSTMNCSSCYSRCQTCVNSTYCSLCYSGYYLLQVAGVNVNQCISVCPMGYYSTLLRTCIPCAANCNVCLNSTYCTVCASNYYLFTSQTTNVTTMSCVTKCPTGYSNPPSIDGTGQCNLCSSNCISCIDFNTCTQCVSSLYALSSSQCIPYNCLNCQDCDTTNNVCRNCTSPYFINNGGCTAFCPNGYFGDTTTGRCTKCMQNCILCFDSTSCTQCAETYVYVSASRSCENQGFVDFGAIGNMSGFTSNITQVMSTVYVSTSAGPIAFGALSNTYGMMQVCQFMYFLQGSCGDNPELTHFLNSLSMVSYSQNPNNQNATAQSASRLLTGIDYTSSFLQTNLPIFLMIIGFISAYVLVVLFQKYNESCCINYPTARKYISYICQFMHKRFKYIYVDCIMWISYLPFLYFSILQLQKLSFDSGLNAISTILAFVIIVLYPLYPVFILKKLFDKSDKPEEHLKNYAAITLRLPLDMQEQAKKPMCEGFTCCPKQNPDVSMTQMSLSPWIDAVVRPVYNQDVPEYRQFKYFTIPHFRLAYAAIKYIRKFIFILVAAVCPDPVTTMAVLITLSIVYMLYLIILKPKQKLYLVLEIILETLILFFLIFMLIYLKLGGATVTAMSVIAHAIGFILANSSLAIAIILNIMAYYTIICCLIDLVRHMKNKAEADDLKEKQQQFQAQIDPALFNEKDDLPIEGYQGDYDYDGVHMDLEKDLIKKIQDEDKELGFKENKKKGDDQMTEQNNDEDYQIDQYNLDEKQFNVRSSMINKKKSETHIEGNDIPNLKQSQDRRRKREAKKEEPKYEGNTEDQIMMGKSKVESEDSNVDVNEGLVKSKENDKYRRKVGNNDLNVEKGVVKQVTDRFRRPKHKNTDSFKPEQQSLDYLYASPNTKPGRKEQQVEDLNTHDRIKGNNEDNRISEGEVISRKIKPKDPRKNNDLEEVDMKERQRLEKEKIKKAQEEVQVAKMRQRERNKKANQDPFGDFEQILEPSNKNNVEDLAMKQRQKRVKERAQNKEKLTSEFLVDPDVLEIVQRKPQAKKAQNKFYKGSDEEGEIGQVKMKEKQPNKFKRNIKNEQKVQQQNIQGVGKDIYTKKAQKKQSARQFAQDNTQELTFKEREGRGINRKPPSVQQRQTFDLQQAKGLERQKRKAQKQTKPSIYDNIRENLAESITFQPEVKVRQPKSINEPDFQEQNMQKQRRQRENALRRQKDNKLQVSSNLQESYDDVVNKNKQQVFKQDITKMSHLLDIEGDGFEEQEYAPRPQSKIQRPKSRAKDGGLSATNKAEDSQDDSYDTRKQRNLASRRLRKKGNLQMNEDLKVEEDSVSRDSRRISKIKEKKLKVKSGVLNIDDNSQSEDIEEFKFH